MSLYHTQKAADRYAPTIELINANFPSVVVVNPAPQSIHTFRSRLRDAITGAVRYNHTLPISRTDLKKWCDLYIVAVQGNLAYIGGREEVKARLGKDEAVGTPVTASIIPSGVAYNSQNTEVVQALLTLYEHKQIDSFTLSPCTLTEAEEIIQGKGMTAVQGPNGITIF